jgi:hypothetical protein
MERPLVAGGGDGVQIWRVAAIVLNKQLPKTDREWSFSFGDGKGVNSSP